jgi:hypothetical protein
MLILGENKLVMASFLKDFKGKIDLIYIDPPFNVGRILRWHFHSVKLLDIHPKGENIIHPKHP